jgi:hypothetical protein
MFKAILHTISYTVFRWLVQNWISLSIAFLQTGYEFLKMDSAMDLVWKLPYLFTPLLVQRRIKGISSSNFIGW